MSAGIVVEQYILQEGGRAGNGMVAMPPGYHSRQAVALLSFLV